MAAAPTALVALVEPKPNRVVDSLMEAGLHIRPVYNVNLTGYSLIQRLTEAQEPGVSGIGRPSPEASY
jgi:hypothetical protein